MANDDRGGSSDTSDETSSSESLAEEDVYHLRVRFRNLATRGCLWPANDKAIQRFGCAVVNHNELEISDDLKCLITYLMDKFVRRSPWSPQQWISFQDESCILIPWLADELGPKYVVFDDRDNNL